MPLDFKRMSPKVVRIVFPVHLLRRFLAFTSEVFLLLFFMDFVTHWYIGTSNYFHELLRS